MSHLLLGCHVGMSGKSMFEGSVEEAAGYGANVLMVYTGAPQNTRRKPVGELNADAGWAKARELGVEQVVVHAPYIVNLANTAKPETFELGVGFLGKELVRAEALGAKTVVLHPGAHVGAGTEAGIAQLVKGLNRVLQADETDVTIALETMAGKGSEIGKSFEELAQVYQGVEKSGRLRVCFDTCHVNDAGYDLANDYEGVLGAFDASIGLGQISVIHVNDSKNPCGSRKDRHANIGEGTLGLSTLKRIVHDGRFADVPKILETPWRCEEGSAEKTIPPYKKEIELLRGE